MKVVAKKSLKMKNWQNKSWNFVISNGILLLYSTQFVPFSAKLRNVAISFESPHVGPIQQNTMNAKFELRDGHGKLRNGEIMEKSWKLFFCKVSGSPWSIP